MLKQKAKGNIYALVIGALTVMLVFNIATCVMAFADEMTPYEISGTGMLNAIEWEQYYRLRAMTSDVTAQRRAENATIDECCHIAEYYEAASLYRAYTGDDAQQQVYQQMMDSCRVGVPTLGYTLDDIDAIFEIG